MSAVTWWQWVVIFVLGPIAGIVACWLALFVFAIIPAMLYDGLVWLAKKLDN